MGFDASDEVQAAVAAIAMSQLGQFPPEIDKVRALELIGRQCGLFGEASRQGRGGLKRAMRYFLADISAALERRRDRTAGAQQCGAKTRRGTACRCHVEPGRPRCRLHGGRSTGPKTAEGKRRSLAALKAGHRRWRDAAKPAALGHQSAGMVATTT